jgi:hypothetical protein
LLYCRFGSLRFLAGRQAACTWHDKMKLNSSPLIYCTAVKR